MVSGRGYGASLTCLACHDYLKCTPNQGYIPEWELEEGENGEKWREMAKGQSDLRVLFYCLDIADIIIIIIIIIIITVSTSSTSASLSPASPLDNIFALPAEVFSSCLAIVSAVMVDGLYLWPALRYGTGYQTVWEIWLSAETPSSVHRRRFYFQLTRVHSALELSGRCALQMYLLTYLLTSLLSS